MRVSISKSFSSDVGYVWSFIRLQLIHTHHQKAHMVASQRRDWQIGGDVTEADLKDLISQLFNLSLNRWACYQICSLLQVPGFQ